MLDPWTGMEPIQESFFFGVAILRLPFLIWTVPAAVGEPAVVL
jgi:hypothetical protein